MNVHTHMTPTYTLELTQDEYVALIAALFMTNKTDLINKYGEEFSPQVIDNINNAQVDLACKFSDIYQNEGSVDIIKKIRLDGFEGEIK